MMKKNLFLLFSFYFFVLQPVFLRLLRGEINFLYLSLINCFFIILISLITKGSKNSTNDDKIILEDLKPFHHVQKVEKHKSISHLRFFIISVLFGFIVWFSLSDMIIYLQLFVVVLGSFVLFILFGLIFKFRIFKTWETKLYICVIFLILIRSIIEIFNINLNNLFEKIQVKEQANNISEPINVVNEGELSDEVLSFLPNINDKNLDVNATFEDVIKYLVDEKDLKINNNKNIKFDYISYNNQDYNYYRTAYSLGMIGKNLNPSKNLLCETYVVMLGLAESWNLTKGTDIKKSYWNYANDNNKLPKCKYGEFITLADFHNNIKND